MSDGFVLTVATECIREMIANANRSEISAKAGVPYPRIGYLMRNSGRVVRADDLERLLKYFGYTVTVTPPLAPFPPDGWQPHPTAPGWYYKGQQVVTKAQLKEMIAEPAAAE